MKQVLLLTLLLAFTAQAFEFTGKVVGVTDGDTITVLYQGNKQYKIRLQHIDCPEAAQDFGSKAKKALSAKVFGQVVTIKWDEMDRYKRVLGDVYIGKRWVNLEMVREGMAWHYRYYSKDVAMAAAETRARAAKMGILVNGKPHPAVGLQESQGSCQAGDWAAQHGGVRDPQWGQVSPWRLPVCCEVKAAHDTCTGDGELWAVQSLRAAGVEGGTREAPG